MTETTATTEDLLDQLEDVTARLEKAVTRLEIAIQPKPEEDRGSE